VRDARRTLRDVQSSVEELTAQVRELNAARKRDMAVPPAEEEQVERARFDRRTLKRVRRRFDLTQEELAELLEVSPVTVTSWETGKSRPRKSNLAQIITLRSMEQREVDEALGREHLPPSISPAEVKRIRRQHDLTQQQMGQLIGVSTGAVTAWETGKTEPTRDNRKAVLELADVPRAQVDVRLGRMAGQEGAEGAPRRDLSPDDIRDIRRQADMTQKQMADRLGVSANTISNWETGRTEPRRSSVQKLVQMRA
jgi:DNA-binding transcriptional regulator YiaG